MDNFYLSALIREIATDLTGRVIGSVKITRSRIRVNLKPPGKRALVAILDPDWSGIFVSDETSSRGRDEPEPAGQFASFLQEYLSGARIQRAAKAPGDRVIQFVFQPPKRSPTESISLTLELTGRRVNAHLYDQAGRLLHTMLPGKAEPGMEGPFESDGAEERRRLEAELEVVRQLDDTQQVIAPRILPGPLWRAELMERAKQLGPAKGAESLIEDLLTNEPRGRIYSKYALNDVGDRLCNPRTDLILSHVDLEQARHFYCTEYDSLSDAAQAYFLALGFAGKFNQVFLGTRQAVAREAAKRRATLAAMEADRQRFGEPDRLKRAGELLLANLATARISGNAATVVDYFDPMQSEVRIELPEGATLQEAATDYFNRYRKATRALAATESRKTALQLELDKLDVQLQRLDSNPVASQLAITRKAVAHLGVRIPEAAGADKKRATSQKKDAPAVGRRFQSSDGYVIVVGKNDRENDQITFRIARSDDIWMHAADYPGSHVVVRNPTRNPVPHRTITEAAQLAAINSQARGATKVAVHYTLRKFVSKPPRAKPGLVRLSSFKTILVEPRSNLSRLE